MKKDTIKKTAKKPAIKKEEDLFLFPESESGNWMTDDEGKLAVDVMETDRSIVIRSAIAGVLPEDIQVSVHNDLLTIRGQRHSDGSEKRGNWLVRECHWGAFSRSLILPAEVDTEKIDAELKNGVLTVTLPKVVRERRIEVKEK